MFFTSGCHQHICPCLMFLATADTFCAPCSENFSCTSWTFRGQNPGRSKSVFFFFKAFRSSLEFTQSPIHWVPESILGGKAAGWSYTSAPPVSLCGVDWEKFTLLYALYSCVKLRRRHVWAGNCPDISNSFIEYAVGRMTYFIDIK